VAQDVDCAALVDLVRQPLGERALRPGPYHSGVAQLWP